MVTSIVFPRTLCRDCSVISVVFFEVLIYYSSTKRFGFLPGGLVQAIWILENGFRTVFHTDTIQWWNFPLGLPDIVHQNIDFRNRIKYRIRRHFRCHCRIHLTVFRPLWPMVLANWKMSSQYVTYLTSHIIWAIYGPYFNDNLLPTWAILCCKNFSWLFFNFFFWHFVLPVDLSLCNVVPSYAVKSGMYVPWIIGHGHAQSLHTKPWQYPTLFFQSSLNAF